MGSCVSQNSILKPQFGDLASNIDHLIENSLYYFWPLTNSVFFFHLDKKVAFKLDFKNRKIPKWSDSVEVGGKIYLFGGANEDLSKQYSVVLELDLSNEDFVKKRNMKERRMGHSATSIEPNFVFVTGGVNAKGTMKECEKYNSKTNKWAEIPPLNEAKCCHSVTSFNLNLLYCFGGCRNLELSKPFSSIEKFNIEINSSWDMMWLQSNEGWTPRTSIGCIQASFDSILLFGGNLETPSEDIIIQSSDTLIFNTNAEAIYPLGGRMKKGANFRMRRPKFYKADLFMMGFAPTDIHICSFESYTWKYLEEKKWNPSHTPNIAARKPGDSARSDDSDDNKPTFEEKIPEKTEKLISNCVHLFWHKKNCVLFLDMNTNKVYKVEIKNKKIGRWSDSVEIDKRIFVMGGGNEDLSEYLSCMDELKPEEEVLEERRNMSVGRMGHSGIDIGLSLIYVCGGLNAQGLLNHCEKYHIHLDQWNHFPSINHPKACVSLSSFQTTLSTYILYSFGGSKAFFLSDTFASIEKIDISQEQLGWQLVPLMENDGWTARANIGCIQYSEDSILLFGGSLNVQGDTNKRLQQTNECFLFNIYTDSMVKLHDGLVNENNFRMRKPKLNRRKATIVALSFLPCDLNVFSKITSEWNSFQEKLWNPDPLSKT
jgi:hypothetical protein